MAAPNPAIVLVSEHHVDTLLDEFGRYARDYDLCAATSFVEAAACIRKVLDGGGQVAMVVSESVLALGWFQSRIDSCGCSGTPARTGSRRDYSSPERAALNPDPAELIERAETAMVTAVG